MATGKVGFRAGGASLAALQPDKRGIKHICWDGCMFPNETLEKQETWNTILGAMIKVDEAI